MHDTLWHESFRHAARLQTVSFHMWISILAWMWRQCSWPFIDVWVTISSEASGWVFRPLTLLPSETASHSELPVGTTLTNGPSQFNVAALVLQCTNSASSLTGLEVLTQCIKACACVLALRDKACLAFFNDLPARYRRVRCVSGRPCVNRDARWRAGRIDGDWQPPLALQRYCCVMLFYCGVGLSVCLNLKSLERCLFLLNMWS